MCHKLPSWMFARISALLILMLTGASLTGASLTGAAVVHADEQHQAPIDFEKQIRPLLTRHCGNCHGAKEQKSSLRLDARHAAFRGGDGGAVIVPGKPDESELLRRIRSTDDDRMPPEGPALSSSETELLSRWIADGADWPESDYDRAAKVDPRLQHWSFQPLKPQLPPEVSIPEHLRDAGITEIDRFLLAELSKKSLVPNDLADRHNSHSNVSLWIYMVCLPNRPE